MRSGGSGGGVPPEKPPFGGICRSRSVDADTAQYRGEPSKIKGLGVKKPSDKGWVFKIW